MGIEKCSRPTFILTMLHKREEPFAVFGAVGEQELVGIGGRNGDPNLFEYPEEPKVPAELMEHSMPEEVDQVDPQGASGKPTPSFQWQLPTRTRWWSMKRA